MRRRAPLRGFPLALALATAACGSSEDAPAQAGDDPIVITDASGVERRFVGPASRIVSLVPSATQTLRALGADSLLVGRTDFDTDAWSAELPSVGGGLDPSLERLVALSPDLVIRFAGEQDPRTPARLDDLGIPQLVIRPDRIADVIQTIDWIGELTASHDRAAALVASIRGELQALEAAVSTRPPLTALYVLGGTPPWVAGPGTYIDELLELAGGRNVFADLGTLYGAVSPEEIRARDIEVVLVSETGAFDARLAPEARIVAVGGGLEIPGPGVAEAAWRLAELLHGTVLR